MLRDAGWRRRRQCRRRQLQVADEKSGCVGGAICAADRP
jgi:hypothetical protein